MKTAWLKKQHTQSAPATSNQSVSVRESPCQSAKHAASNQSVSVRESPCQSTTYAGTNNTKLIIFFAGWGMSPAPFSFLDCEDNDVLMVYDYTNNNMQINLPELLASYKQVDLIAWSLGVAISNIIMQPFQDKLQSALAINGSIMPIHNNFGIPPDIFQATIENLLNGGITGFYRRMCKTPIIRKRFMSTPPDREPDDLKDELIALYDKLNNITPDNSIFKHAIVCNDDKIIPPDNQTGCWNHFNVPYALLKAPHFPFYEWSAWRRIIC